jgi:2-polyprenyl-3-methyl-5-hydroxy-6-metoxy-1,4-benzoquinol methylase
MNSKAYQKNLRNNLAISGESATFFAEYQAQKLAHWFAQDLEQNISILDFGCGDGLMTSFIHHLFENATITGIDTDAQRIALAKDMYEGIDFMCGDMEVAQPCAPASFDLIYTTEVFHHLPSEKHAQYIALLMGLLRPGGTLIIFELNPLNLATVYRFKRNPLEQNARLIMPWHLRHLLMPYGSTKIRYYDFNLPTRKLEPYLMWFPFGGLYAVSVKKNS